jgi:predicted nucleic acid-binding protein
VASLLIDLSAWARSSHRSARARWKGLVEGDELACHPVFALELLHNSINAEDHQRLRNDLEAAFDWVWPNDDTARLALRLQQRMATARACAQRVKTADILISALAVQHQLGVLHYDADYDLIRRYGGERFDSRWLAPRGTLEGPSELANQSRSAYRKAFGERMVQLQGNADLEVWPEVIAWMDRQLADRALPIPGPPDIE